MDAIFNSEIRERLPNEKKQMTNKSRTAVAIKLTGVLTKSRITIHRAVAAWKLHTVQPV
jgi:hypothetical protein